MMKKLLIRRKWIVIALALILLPAVAYAIAVSALTALTGANTAAGDLFVVVDISEAAAADRTKNITRDELAIAIAANIPVGGLKDNSVALTTDTTGNYVATVAAGAGITIAEGDGEGATKTVVATLGTTIVTGEITDGTILEADLDADVTAVDGDFLTYDSTGANFTWRSPGETLSDIGGITASSTDTFTNKTLDCNGSGNACSNIDVADLANGVDGELITWSASAAPATVAAGSSGQILTSNGAGAAPTFQAAAGGGGGGAWTFISSQTASSSSSIDFTSGIDSTYELYMFVYAGIHPATGGVEFALQVSTDGGSTFETGAHHYHTEKSTVTTAYTAVAASNGTTYLICYNVGTGASNAASGRVFLAAPSGATQVKLIWGDGTSVDSSHSLRTCNHNGFWDGGGTAIDAIRFLMSSGNIASGVFYLYGLSKS